MKAKNGKLAVSVLTLAVQSAVAAMVVLPISAMAEGEDDVVALTNPTNSIEVGASNSSKPSAKFGEYNGLNKDGAEFVGNVSIKGGDAYGQGLGTTRWSITGTELGLTSREIGATVSSQGRWNLGANYDQLRHNISDSYQTPLQGSLGSNNFTLPTAFGTVGTARPSTSTSTVPDYGTNALSPTQIGYLQTKDVHSDRDNTTFNAGYNFDTHWNVRFDYNHLEQSGGKLIAASSDFTAGVSTTTGYVPGKEQILILMNPTQSKTDTFNLALNWAGDKAFFTAAYYGSLYRNDYDRVNFVNPYDSGNTVGGAITTYPTNSLSTAPDNDFHQINLSGGYNLTPTTKMVGGYSYARNTQDVGYVNLDQMQTSGLPRSSLNGLVVTTHANLKVTDRTTKNLTLTAGLKYDDRDNQTASNTYNWYDLGHGAVTSISTPKSDKHTQFELAGDYRIDQRQNVRLAYEYEQMKRWCDSSPSYAQIIAASTGRGSGGSAATTAAAYYGLGSSCVQVPENTENKLVTNYRLRTDTDLDFNVGYTYSRRKADVNTAFYNPMQGQNQGFELPGFVAFFDAARTEHVFKAGVGWQATSALNVSLNGRYLDDDYTDKTLGVQAGHSWSVNLDGTYSIADNSSISTYLSFQQRKRDLKNDAWGHAAANYGVVNSTTGSLSMPWTNNLDEDDTTLGLSFKQGGLMAGKLDLRGDLTYSLSKSSYSTALNYVDGASMAACTTASNAGYSCGTLPDIKSDLIQLKLTGDYKVDKARKVVVGYLYQRLKADDYMYNGFQLGATPATLMPTNQQPGSYSQNVVYVTYNYSFR